MKIQNTPINYNPKVCQNFSTKPAFKGLVSVETIKHYNLGMMSNGYIGKVKLLKANGEEAILNVEKRAFELEENYKLKDDVGKIIGEIVLKIRRPLWSTEKDAGHIFVDELRNFSNPKTPYYTKGLEEYKQIGTRLLQIAQRRSDECRLNGNIELISKNESMEFYKKLGFKQTPFLSRFDNPNKMYLPPDAKEPLSRMYGGL